MSGRVGGGAAVSPGTVKGGRTLWSFLCKEGLPIAEGLPWLVELVGCPGGWGGEAALSSPAGQHRDYGHLIAGFHICQKGDLSMQFTYREGTDLMGSVSGSC